MSVFDRLFGTPQERRIKGFLKKAEAETSEVYRPLGNLALGIVRAAWDSYQDLAKMLGFSTNGQPTEQQILVFYELLYFSTHITMRNTHGLTQPQISKLQEFLGPQLAHTAVDTFCRHWSIDLKTRMAAEFFDKLNAAEADYSECRHLVLNGKAFEKDSLFGRLSSNVAELFGSASNPAVIMAAKASAVKAFTSTPLEELVGSVARVIDRVKPEDLAALRARPWPA